MGALKLEKIKLEGYKTFQNLDLTLNSINVLIGANGSGKSNFISLFTMFNRMIKEELQHYILQVGGADQILHYGSKVTDELKLELWFAKEDGLANGYICSLQPTATDSLLIVNEEIYFHNRKYPSPYQISLPTPSLESNLKTKRRESENPELQRGVAYYVYTALESCRVYHFHDTSSSARVKQLGNIYDNRFLLPDAANLAAYLYFLREVHPHHYEQIVKTIRLAAPFFGDFILRPHPFNQEKIRLEWRERGSDLSFGVEALSDGTLRFICLTTLFLQPSELLPPITILDEPELGLHPYAIVLLAEMICSAANHTQVILATQSVSLVNQFTPQDILVVDRVGRASSIKRLDESELEVWLEDYALGELWEKNVFGGRPQQ
ncbi:MAG: AAA family ATPase [Blastocatellia bacterium]|nr:AAA family ATPase [Blastocatellia bacterium]